MTQDRQVICRRCGFANVPGDQFCGSCGAFLEWEGEPVAVDAYGAASAAIATGPAPSPPGPVASPGPAPLPATGGTAAAAPQAAASTARASTPPHAAAPPLAAEPDAGLVRCPACGIANQATRTFCQSCGGRLVQAPRVAPTSSAQIAAAVAAPHKAAPPVTRTPPAGVGAPSGGGSRRFAGWIVVMAVLGILAGVGVVLGGSMLRGQGPATGASEAPVTSGALVDASPAPSGGAPSGGAASAAAQGGGASSVVPSTKPAALALTGATASSVVGDLEKFRPGMAIDGDPKTAWQEGAEVEKGQWIEVTFAPATVTGVSIRNGYGASTALYKGNRRLKDVLISIDGGKAVKVQLKDTGKPQAFALSGPAGSTALRITIVSTYPGVKTSVARTPFDDTAVSEITVMGVPGS